MLGNLTSYFPPIEALHSCTVLLSVPIEIIVFAMPLRQHKMPTFEREMNVFLSLFANNAAIILRENLK